MSKQCYLLHRKHIELKWVCMHCVALAEECSRILKGAIAVDKSTGRKSSVIESDIESTLGQMASEDVKSLPQEKEAVRSRSNKSTKNKNKKKEKKNKPQTGVGVQTQVENGLQKRVELLEKQIRELQQSTQVLLSRTKNVLLHNLAEPTIREAKARREADRKRVQDIFRLAGMPPTTPIIRYHRVGIWKEAQSVKPRPLLVVFPNTHARDMLLARAYMIQVNTCGSVGVTPDEGIQKKVHVPEIVRKETENRGSPQIKLTKIPSNNRVALPKADAKQKCMPLLRGVGGSPIGKSTPQQEKRKPGGPKIGNSKVVPPKVDLNMLTQAKQPESVRDSKYPSVQPVEKTEKTVSPVQVVGKRKLV